MHNHELPVLLELATAAFPPTMSFPTDFTWGVAAAAYQIEGAWNSGGKGPSVWDMFVHQPGKIAGAHNGDAACDHHRLYRQDVALMQAIGVKAYRLSISWPRVLAGGHGRDQPRRARFLRRARRRAAGRGHRAVGDALPLGLSLRAFPARRLAQSREPEMVRRVHARGGQPALRPRAQLDHAQRAAMLPRPRPPDR